MKPFKRPRVRGQRRAGTDNHSKSSTADQPSLTTPSRGSDPCETLVHLPSNSSSSWTVSIGQEVKSGQLLSKGEGGEDVISGYDGKVVSIAGNALRMSYCPHDICLGDLCGVCGRRVAKVSEFSGSEKSGGIAGGRGIGQGQISINVEGGNALQVSRDAAEGKRRKTVERLFQQRKLALVLDLDHTLVHATNDARAMDFAKFKNAEDVHPFKLASESVSGGNGTAKPKFYEHYVKLRPMLRSFLENIHNMYEMYIYTAGTRSYAEEVVKLIDPEGRFFQQRIFSRTDFKTLDITREKSLRRIFPVDDSMVLILDDRADVWKSDLRNLMTIKPYHFFIGMHEVNNQSGPSYAEDKQAEADQSDEVLKHIQGLLSWIHNKFYASSKGSPGELAKQLAHEGSDVKVLLKQLRARIFGMDKSMHIHIRLHRHSQQLIMESTAHRCGARIGLELNKTITHVVADNAKSEAALKAKQMGVWALAPEWLLACEHNWYREPETKYSLFALYNRDASKKIEDRAGSATQQKKSDGGAKAENEEVDEFGYPVGKKSGQLSNAPTDDFGYPLESRTSKDPEPKGPPPQPSVSNKAVEGNAAHDITPDIKGEDDNDEDDELADLANDIEAELGSG